MEEFRAQLLIMQSGLTDVKDTLSVVEEEVVALDKQLALLSKSLEFLSGTVKELNGVVKTLTKTMHRQAGALSFARIVWTVGGGAIGVILTLIGFYVANKGAK